MSIHVVKAVRQIALPPNEKAVLVAFAEHANHDGTNARPSVELVAWETSYSEPQTRRIIKSLREKNLLVPESSIKGGRGRVICYRVCPENGINMIGFNAPKPYHLDAVNPIISSPKPYHLNPLNPIIEDPFPSPRAYRTVSEPSVNGSAAASARETESVPVPASAAAAENEPDESAFLEAIARHGEGIRQAEGRAGVGFHTGHTPPMKAAAEALLTWYLAAFPERVHDLTAKLRAASQPVAVANQARYLRLYLLDCLAGAVPPVLDVSDPPLGPPPRVASPRGCASASGPPDRSRLDRRARLKARLDPMFAQGGMPQ